MLQKVRRGSSLLAAFLNTFFVINVHVEVGAMLDGHGDRFIVDHLGMLDGRGSRQDRIFNSLGSVSMYSDA